MSRRDFNKAKQYTKTEVDALKVNMTNKHGFNEYGFFVKPSDFTPTLPCDFYRDSNGVVQHNMDFAQYTNGATDIYVNYDTGNDTTGNGSSGTPYQTLKKAGDIVAAAASGTYKIIVENGTPFRREESIGQLTFTNKTVSIVPNINTRRIIMSMGQRNLTWVQDGTGTWKASRTGVNSVFDYREKDSDGAYVPYIGTATLAECQATSKTWYTDDTYIWVHTSDGLIPSDMTISASVSTSPRIVLLGTSKLFLQNVDFAVGSTADGFAVVGDLTGSTVVGEFCALNCTFVGGNLKNGLTRTGNALFVMDIKKTYLFNCVSSYSKSDCFNYHFAEVPTNNRRDCLVLEYNCKSRDAGVYSSSISNNNTTCHEGINVLRIASVGSNASIPCADVDDCYSILIDCVMNGARYIYSGDYYFGSPNTTGGKAILINSIGLSRGLYADVNTYTYGYIGSVFNDNNAVTSIGV